MDRIDIHIEVPAVPEEELLRQKSGECSVSVRQRVASAWQLQHARQGKLNNELSGADLDRNCLPSDAAMALLRQAIGRLGLSARAYHRVLRIARTIADLDGMIEIGTAHVAEAIQYRRIGGHDG